MNLKVVFFCGVLFFLLLFLNSTFLNEKYQVSKPEIFGIYPKRSFVGEVVTIYGKNFKNRRFNSSVQIGDINCKDYDFDYVYWSDNIIKVKVPTGAKTSNIKLNIENTTVSGPTLAVYYEDCFTYSNPMEVTIDYSLSIYSYMDREKPLHIWVPSATVTDTQRNVTLISASKEYTSNTNGMDLFKLKTAPNRWETISKRFKYTSYQLTTKIDPESVTDEYDYTSDFYKYYTSPLSGVESNDPRIKAIAQSIVGNEKNPYYKAKKIYDWVIEKFDYLLPPQGSVWRALDCLDTGLGDCSVYSFIFCALCHAAGIPARPVGGHVIFIDEEVSVHVWAEFFLPKYGWIPVDPNYGDIQVNGFLPREKYFGNIDNRHIAFSKGFIELDLPKNLRNSSDDKPVVLSFLQKYYVYPESDLNYYTIYKKIKRVL